MKNRLLQWIVAFLMVLPFFSFASALKPVTTAPATSSSLQGMSIKQIMDLTPREYREMTGRKMSLRQRLALKLTQRQMRKELKHHPDVDVNAPVAPGGIFDTSDFNPWALVLGLVPVIGILIAYLTNDNTIIKWAWVGTGIVVLIFLLFLIF